MSKALVNAMIWGVLFFLVDCFVHNFIFSNSHVFLADADQIFETTVMSALGFYFGYGEGKGTHDDPLKAAVVWGGIVFVVSILFDLIFSRVFDHLLVNAIATAFVSGLGFYFGYSGSQEE